MSDHYFSASPSVRSRRSEVELVLPDITLSLTTDRGTFSADRVDPGTKYLLQEAPRPPAGAATIADIGCGYGPIACVVAARCPDAHVWAIDVNERAVELCRHNAAARGLANVSCLLVDAAGPTADLPSDVRFDVIYANPPIRVGKEELHRMLLTWLQLLRPGGHAYLVVQKHLGADSLQRWLEAHGYPTERLGARAGYRILDASAPA